MYFHYVIILATKTNAFYTCTKIEEINYGRLKQLINYVLFLNTRRQQLQKVVSVVVFAATLDYIINYSSIYRTGYCQYILRVPQNPEKSATQI